MTPQAHTVLKHLEQVGSITPIEAHTVLKVRSVSARITEIVRAGYTIAKSIKKDSTGQRYIRYSISRPNFVLL
jgi:hypothetical protein